MKNNNFATEIIVRNYGRKITLYSYGIEFATLKVFGDYASFVCKDVKDLTRKPIVEIADIYVCPAYRNKGIATKLINYVIKDLSERYIILTRSSTSMKEYYEHPSDEIINSNNISLGKFFEKLNFSNINELVGYESGDAYLYTGNELGKKTLYKINSFLSKEEERKC